MPVNGLFGGVDASASALDGEALRMNVASENLAHAGDTRHLANGLPYARQRVSFSAMLDHQGKVNGQVDSRIVSTPKYTYHNEPGHPDADANGTVTEPDIKPILELTDLLVASKAYEANANAATGLFHMHEAALRLGDGS